MMLPTDGFRDLNGVRLHYLAWGAAMSPPLVLLHSSERDAHQWDAYAPALATRWWVLAPDARGVGASTGTAQPATASVRLDDLADFINIMGLDRPVLAACGDAGVLALRYAAAFPDRARAVITVETALHLAGEDWRPLIGRIACQVLLIERATGGMHTRLAGQFITALRDSRAALVEHTAPPLLTNAPDAVARLLHAFLDDVLARAASAPRPPRPLDLA